MGEGGQEGEKRGKASGNRGQLRYCRKGVRGIDLRHRIVIKYNLFVWL